MGKRSKFAQRAAEHEADDDKPAWAVDPDLRHERPRRTPAQAQARGARRPSAEGDFAAPLVDTVSSDVAARLSALRAELEAEAQPQAPAKVRAQPSRRRPKALALTAQDGDESFEKLFNPKDDEASFEELLNQSKLDWKAFK